MQRSASEDGIRRYLDQHAKIPRAATGLPEPAVSLGLCIVIPALAESADLPEVLASLETGSRRLSEAEVIVVVNNGDQAGQDILGDNHRTLEMLRPIRPSGLAVYGLDCATPGNALPESAANVGMARRLGMDLAVQRLFRKASAIRGTIACLDADSPVAPGYVDRLLEAFQAPHPPAAALCGYAHPLPADSDLRRAVAQYEVWLRFFEFGLTLAGSRYAATPIGSCLVVGSEAYARADGMVIRDAGEDFYFWQKLVKSQPSGRLLRLGEVQVFPGTRISNRMPFGTSRALYSMLQDKGVDYRQREHSGAFLALRDLHDCQEALYSGSGDLACVQDGTLREFLRAEGAETILRKMRRIYPDRHRFVQAWLQWFDGLRSIRFIHRYTDRHGTQDIFESLETFCSVWDQAVPEENRLGKGRPEKPDWEAWLVWLRSLRLPRCAG